MCKPLQKKAQRDQLRVMSNEVRVIVRMSMFQAAGNVLTRGTKRTKTTNRMVAEFCERRAQFVIYDVKTSFRKIERCLMFETFYSHNNTHFHH